MEPKKKSPGAVAAANRGGDSGPSKSQLQHSHNCRDGQYSRRAAAVHEAGHAVVHAFHGIRVKYVKVSRVEGKHWIGWTATELQPDVDPTSTIPGDLSVGAGHLAGYLAETLHHSENAQAPDELFAASLVENCLQSKGWSGDLHQYTRDILQRNTRPLLLIADALMNDKRIHGQRLKYLLQGVM